ncbi:MAG: cupin domain-containing protein [Vicinamibacterales bacterium]
MSSRIAAVVAFSVALALGSVPTLYAQSSVSAPLMSKDLPEFAGKEVVMSTVTYPAGVASAPHRHDAHTFVYVLEGTVVMQVEGGQPMTLGPGQTFYENPTDVHATSKNASQTQPAKILVFMLKDKGKPATRPAK